MPASRILALPDQPLVHGRLGDEEGPGDLGVEQAAEQPQGERDLGARGQGRVAAGEDQPQALVGHGLVLVEGLERLGGRPQPDGLAVPALAHRVAAEAVDRPVSGRRDDPPRRDAGSPSSGQRSEAPRTRPGRRPRRRRCPRRSAPGLRPRGRTRSGRPARSRTGRGPARDGLDGRATARHRSGRRLGALATALWRRPGGVAWGKPRRGRGRAPRNARRSDAISAHARPGCPRRRHERCQVVASTITPASCWNGRTSMAGSWPGQPCGPTRAPRRGPRPGRS